jgi:hypothetical protein
MRISLAASLAAFWIAACASTQQPSPQKVEVNPTGVPGEAAAASYHKITATVLAVDTTSRKLTLKGEDGHVETVNVPPEVKRLKEITAGDKIEVEVQEGLLFQYQPAGSSYVPPAAVVTGARAGADQPPGAAAAAAVQSTVTIVGIDSETRIVQIQDLDGNKYEVKAGPKISLDKLSVGDRLVATYAASVAISIAK